MSHLGAVLGAVATAPADGTCYESSAPAQWLDWGLIAGTATVAVAMVAMTLFVQPSRRRTGGRHTRFRRWWSRLPQLLAVVLVVLLLVVGAGAVAPELRTGYAVQSLLLVLALAPLVVVTTWRARTLRRGDPLGYRQHVVVACAQVVALTTAVAALVMTVVVVVAYAQATVPVDCSLVGR
jgi:hypothetical protein